MLIAHLSQLERMRPEEFNPAVVIFKDHRAVFEHFGDGKRQNDSAGEAIHAKLPGLLLLARPGIDKRHQEHDVGRRCEVEDLGAEVPPQEPFREDGSMQEIEIACDKNEDVQDLGNERDAL